MSSKRASAPEKNENPVSIEKQKGAHVFGKIDSSNFRALNKNNIEWITLVSWCYQDEYNSPFIRHHNGDSSMLRQQNANWLERINLLHTAGFKDGL